MLSNGTVIKFVGNSKANRLAKQKGIENWHPDGLTWDFGIVESSYCIREWILYRCRIVLLDDVPMEHPTLGTYPTCRHYRLDLYDFEVEDV